VGADSLNLPINWAIKNFLKLMGISIWKHEMKALFAFFTALKKLWKENPLLSSLYLSQLVCVREWPADRQLMRIGTL
jgi:hypothetical protein